MTRSVLTLVPERGRIGASCPPGSRALNPSGTSAFSPGAKTSAYAPPLTAHGRSCITPWAQTRTVRPARYAARSYPALPAVPRLGGTASECRLSKTIDVIPKNSHARGVVERTAPARSHYHETRVYGQYDFLPPLALDRCGGGAGHARSRAGHPRPGQRDGTGRRRGIGRRGGPPGAGRGRGHTRTP